MNRRHFLNKLVSLHVITLAGCTLTQDNDDSESLLLSACSDAQNNHFVAGIRPNGSCLFLIPVPERAHDSLYIPQTRQALFFGRSPGHSIYIIDVDNKAQIQTISAAPNRYFSGHGILTPDLRLLVTENDTLSKQGKIGVYDPLKEYKRIDEFSSFGIEPHQILAIPDSSKVVLANGGLIKNAEDSIVNTADFTSSIVYLDTGTGQCLDQYFADHPQNSLRHMTIDQQGTVFIGAQSYNADIIPLIYQHKGEAQLLPFLAEEFIWQAHNRYTASLAVIDNILAVTSPRGNLTSFWNTQLNSYLTHEYLQDCAGISPFNTQHKGFSISNGLGDIDQIHLLQSSHTLADAVSTIKLKMPTQIAWDNHMNSVQLKQF